MGWPPGVVEHMCNSRVLYGVPEDFVETFNSYIENGVTYFTCTFLDIKDMITFSEEVIPDIL